MYHFKGSWPSLTCIRQFPFSQLTLEAVGSAKPPNGQSWLAKPSSYTNKFLQCGSIITITFHDLTTSGYWSQYRGTEASRTTSTQMEWEKKRKKQKKKNSNLIQKNKDLPLPHEVCFYVHLLPTNELPFMEKNNNKITSMQISILTFFSFGLSMLSLEGKNDKQSTNEFIPILFIQLVEMSTHSMPKSTDANKYTYTHTLT